MPKKTLPAHLRFTKDKTGTTSEGSALKRKRESSSGGAVVTATAYADPNKKPAAAASTAVDAPVDKVPGIWRLILDEAAAASLPVPPATVVLKMAEIREECLTGFRSAQSWLQKANSTNEKFARALSTGSVPSVVSAHLKLPPLQVMKGAPGIESDPKVAEARTVAEKDIETATASSTKLVGAFYTAQANAIRRLVHVPTVSDVFAKTLKEYAARVVTDALGGDAATNIWDPVIERFKATLVTELESLNYEFVAVLARESETKEAKANAVETARADAEMVDATRPSFDVEEACGDQEAGNEGFEGQGEGRRQRKRKRRAHPARGEEGKAQGKESGVAGQRQRLATVPSSLHVVSSWVRPSGTRFHHHRPDTYPAEFFVAPPAVRSRFVTSQMSALYYDTRIRNRSFHNMSNVPLSLDQAKMLSLNPKFV
ncbi:hypothetical protein C8R47DRAFT_975987, partial [Mycena vitilis]